MHEDSTHLADQDSTDQDSTDQDSLTPTTVLDAEQLFAALDALQAMASNTGFQADLAVRVSDALLDHYSRSAEAAPFTDPLEGPHMVVDFAARHHEVTLTALNGRQLEELLFSIIPARVAVVPERAATIVQTVRALYVWLGRECGLEQAVELVELLGDDATRELEQRLGDPENYDPSKLMTMALLAAGIDPSSQAEISAFMREQVGMNLGSGVGGNRGYPFENDISSANTPRLTPEQKLARQKKRKSNRKSARKSRRKNR